MLTTDATSCRGQSRSRDRTAGDEFGFGLIVVGGRDLNEIERTFVGIFPYFVGDFSDVVFHRARCPILVVRALFAWAERV